MLPSLRNNSVYIKKTPTLHKPFLYRADEEELTIYKTELIFYLA